QRGGSEQKASQSEFARSLRLGVAIDAWLGAREEATAKKEFSMKRPQWQELMGEMHSIRGVTEPQGAGNMIRAIGAQHRATGYQMIESLSIENFRAFKKVEVHDLQRLNVV